MIGETRNGTHIPGPAQFRTQNGQTLTTPHGGTIGQAALNYVPIDHARWINETESHPEDDQEDLDQFDYMYDNLREGVDYLVEATSVG